ncbi:cilia- and flagella-associated protein 99 [Cololabis saira]|uniref:cilia- and flagella-associated protein 99 n=1 Tax=Cololabis saira TaxID=129043 RepID=UPI002AD31363|nr:cilia- and flagella-associated protein 99 [Cololabis saira]
MALCYGSLVKEALVLLDKFTVDRKGLDQFLDDAEKDLQNRADLERTYILELVSGCIEQKKCLDVVIKAFIEQNGRLSRCDHSLFVIICYLATFCLDNLGLQHFRSIVKSLDINKTSRFLNFFFTNLTSCIQEEWNCIYDADFVEKKFLGPLLRWRPEINSLMDQLASKISQGSKVKTTPTTKPKEFSFTKSRHKPLPVPEPEFIQQQEKRKPALVPKSTYTAPREIQLISKIKEKNHQMAEECLHEANVKQFRCANPEKSEHTKRVIAQIEEDFETKLKLNSCHSRLPPSNMADNCPIKLNNAAILRQEAMYDRQVKEELQRIEQLVQGAGEPSSFLQWQREMLEKDRQEKLPMIEQKYQEGYLSEEKKAVARKQRQERDQRAAQLNKEEKTQLMQRYAEKRLQEEKEMRDLVQQVAGDQKKSKAAKEKLQKLKQTIVKEVSEQNQELLRQALDEEQAKLCRRFEMIHEVHAIESLPHIRFNKFDDTKIAGHELMEEMSMAELKERLAMTKKARQTEQEERRRRILKERQKKKQQLQKKIETIELLSRVKAKAAAAKSGQRLPLTNASH